MVRTLLLAIALVGSLGVAGRRLDLDPNQFDESSPSLATGIHLFYNAFFAKPDDKANALYIAKEQLGALKNPPSRRRCRRSTSRLSGT
jgi:hypothetical protein